VVKRQGAKITYDGGGNKATVGFEGIDVATPAGTIRLVSEPFCPTNRAYVGSLDSLYLAHLSGYPHIIQDDSLRVGRMASDDGVECRVRAVGNLCCTRPGSWAVVAI
jgi:hypothetical protein